MNLGICRFCEGVQLLMAMAYLEYALEGEPDAVVQQKWLAACKAILGRLTEVSTPVAVCCDWLMKDLPSQITFILCPYLTAIQCMATAFCSNCRTRCM